MAEGVATEFAQMVALRDEGALTPREFLVWCARNFADLPGTHLAFDKTTGATWDLVAPDGTVWARCHGGSLTHFHQLWSSIEVGGETFTWRGIGATARKTHELVASSSGETVIRMTGTHFNKQATTRVELIGHDTYVFPMNPIMTAQGSAGTDLAYYRLNGLRSRFNQDPRKMIEVVVNSLGSSTPGFALVVAISTLFPARFNEVPIGPLIT